MIVELVVVVVEVVVVVVVGNDVILQSQGVFKS